MLYASHKIITFYICSIINRLKSSGYYMSCQIEHWDNPSLPLRSVFIFRITLATNTYYFPILPSQLAIIMKFHRVSCAVRNEAFYAIQMDIGFQPAILPTSKQHIRYYLLRNILILLCCVADVTISFAQASSDSCTNFSPLLHIMCTFCVIF